MTLRDGGFAFLALTRRTAAAGAATARRSGLAARRNPDAARLPVACAVRRAGRDTWPIRRATRARRDVAPVPRRGADLVPVPGFVPGRSHALGERSRAMPVFLSPVPGLRDEPRRHAGARRFPPGLTARRRKIPRPLPARAPLLPPRRRKTPRRPLPPPVLPVLLRPRRRNSPPPGRDEPPLRDAEPPRRPLGRRDSLPGPCDPRRLDAFRRLGPPGEPRREPRPAALRLERWPDPVRPSLAPWRWEPRRPAPPSIDGRREP